MSATKHTRGPWETCGLMIRTARTEETGWSGGFIIADFMPSSLLERDANEQLCAAAPELAEALREFEEAFSEFDPDGQASRHRMLGAVIKARAALRKAGVL